jgi:DNA-binding transcriptional LysR family regulator
MVELSVTGLRVLREVAERGSFSAAARALGYTQSAVSRQVAALEAAAGRPLFERVREGARPTPAGRRLLDRARTILAELETARRELDGAAPAARPVRLGAFPGALAAVVPPALRALDGVEVSVREGTTPALVRALRAGALDLALLAASPPFRPFDAESPPLALETLYEDELRVAVGPEDPLAAQADVTLAQLAGRRWVAGRSEAGETLLGVWPGLPGRPHAPYLARDWLSRLRLVAASVAITTVPASAAAVVPRGVRLLGVRDGPREHRRIVLARLPRVAAEGVDLVAGALRSAAYGLVVDSV